MDTCPTTQQAEPRHPEEGQYRLGHRTVAIDELGGDGVDLLVAAHLGQPLVHL